MPVTAIPDTIAPTRTASAAPVSDNPVQGAVLMIVAAAFFTSMTAMIRHLSTSIDPLELVFFRNFFGLVVLLPWLMRNGFGALRTSRLPLLLGRTAVGLTAMITWFSAISIMNLGDAVALSFTAPLFATVAAVFILGEVVRARRWTAVIMGFFGAMIILRPGVIEISPVAMMVLLSSLMMGLSVCLVKLLSRTEPVMTIVFYMVLFLTPASLIPALFVWTTPTLTELAWMLAIGACGSLGHICFTRAFSMAEATAILPFDFVRLPMMAVVGWLAFDQVLDFWSGVGAAVIIATTVYIAHREAVHQRRSKLSEADLTPETQRHREAKGES
jgi:drug/metabolite transporter (DMT)-like permease